MLRPELITQFRRQLHGSVIQPQHAGYTEARKVYNAMIDRKPRWIVQCANMANIAASIEFVRDHGMGAPIRGGGHNAGGLGICDEGLVIDLGRLNSIHVDAAAKKVRVFGGAKWGNVDNATNEFGLAVPSGIISTTGVGGLMLGGLGLSYTSVRPHDR